MSFSTKFIVRATPVASINTGAGEFRQKSSSIRVSACFDEQQIQLTNAKPEEAAKIVFIGERADEITREVLAAQLVMFG